MPIQLTTPFNPGDLDPGKTYAQVKVVGYRVNIVNAYLETTCAYGNTVDGVWTPGVVDQQAHTLAGSDFVELCMEHSVGEETVYQTVSRLLYEWLLEKGFYIGTIV